MNDTTRGTTGYYGSNDQSVAVYVQDPRTSQVSAQVSGPRSGWLRTRAITTDAYASKEPLFFA